MGSCSGDNDDQDGNGNDYDDNEDDDGSYKQLYLEKNSLLVGLGVSGGAEPGRTKTGRSRHFLPTSETLLCFKVKVGAMLPPLLLSYFYFYLLCQCKMFQSLVKRH